MSMEFTPRMQQAITAIAQQHGLDLTVVGTYLRLDQPGYDRLSIEVFAPHQVSVAHYYEFNSDLIPDPEMSFYTGGDVWRALATRQTFFGESVGAYIATDGTYTVRRPSTLIGIVELAEMWAGNIIAQNWLAATVTKKVIPTAVDEPWPADTRCFLPPDQAA